MANEDVVVTDLTVTEDFLKGTLERPKSLAQGDLSGTEDIKADEIRLPRLAIAQGLSNQMMPGDPLYIEGLKLFDMFNDLTSEIYGRGPMTFVPVRRDVRRIEFIPRKEGGGIRDMNVPPGDRRLEWTRDEDTGVGTPPAATTFNEYISVLLRPGRQPEPIVISIKNTNRGNRRAIDSLNTFIKLRNAQIYSGLYTVQSATDKNDKGTYGVPQFKNAGFVNVDNPKGKALFEFCKKFADSLEGKRIVVDRQPGDDADTFDPDNM